LSICPGYTLQAALACAEADEGQAFHFYPAAGEQIILINNFAGSNPVRGTGNKTCYY